MDARPTLSSVSILIITAMLAMAVATSHAAPDGRRAPLFEDLGRHHVPVTTKVPLAQRYFDQGMILAWGFNHAESVRSFREAQRLDPDCAMCYWGEALALGPNINKPMDPGAVPDAVTAITRARELAERATPREQALIAAQATRYAEPAPADRRALDQAYAEAMGEVVQAFPDDLDAAALYAEALMDLMPWTYYEENGEPKPLTERVTTILENVIARKPDHPGALHLYIHAVEASSTPQRAEAAADRLAELVPGSGHLVHMPSHIYLRIGRYQDATRANERAAQADESYLSQCRAQGFYPALYYPHNIHFIWYAATLEGRSEVALAAARKLADNVPADLIGDVPLIEQFLVVPLFGQVRFARWDDVLAAPRPRAEHRYATAMWHAARAIAYAAGGRVAEARAEREAFTQAAAFYGPDTYATHGYPADVLARIAGHLIAAGIADAEGDDTALFDALEQAIALEDGLPYMEPPYWFFPLRPWLGEALLSRGRAVEAEGVFRRDLEKVPANGWSLHGLARSLAAQGRAVAAEEAMGHFTAAWQQADVTPGQGGLEFF